MRRLIKVFTFCLPTTFYRFPGKNWLMERTFSYEEKPIPEGSRFSLRQEGILCENVLTFTPLVKGVETSLQSIPAFARIFTISSSINKKILVINRMPLYTVELQWLEPWWVVYPGCFEFVLESLGKNSLAADLGKLRVIFFFMLKMVYCV